MRLPLSGWNDTAWTHGGIVVVLIASVINNGCKKPVAISMMQPMHQNQQIANNFSIVAILNLARQKSREEDERLTKQLNMQYVTFH